MFDSFLKFLASLFGRRKPEPPSPKLPPSVIKGVAYGADPLQYVDAYLPEHQHDQPMPVIVMVHGGGWRRGEADADNVVANKVAYWGARGWAIVSVSYRLDADPYAMAQDVAAAVDWVRGSGYMLGLDANRMVLMGHSAGGHLVTLVNADASLGPKPWRGTVVLDSAAYNVVAAMQGPHPSLYDDAFGTGQAYWTKCSPFHQLKTAIPPCFLVYSTQRGPANRYDTEGFADKASGLGTKATVYPVDLSHGEVNSTLGLPGAYTDAVDAFIQGVAGK